MRTLLVALGLARATAEQLRVAAMGDSNTAGGAGGMDVATESYPAQLSVLLGGEGWDVRNFGKGGRTVVDIEGRAYRDASAYEEALTWGDDGFEVLIICLGTNDAIPGNEVFPEPDHWVDSETFISQYKDLLADIVSRAGDLRAAFICKPPPLRDGSSQKWSRELIHGELQSDVDEVAAWFQNEYDVYSTTVDFFGALGGDDADSSDYVDVVHPGPSGLGKMAREAERELRAWRYGSDDNGSDDDDDEPEETRRPTRRPTRQPSYRPTRQPTDSGPTPRPPTPRPRPSSDCPALEPLPKDSPDCPEELDIAPCDTPGLGVGELCEGDGECGTDRTLDNCSNDLISRADIYRIVGGTPNYQPTKRPTTDCPSGIKDEYGHCVDEGCTSWYDGCNTCDVRDGRLDVCTEASCETLKEPKCLDANGCADDPTWSYGTKASNTCAYVAQKVKPDGSLARCKKKNTDGERSALEACPATCGTCP